MAHDPIIEQGSAVDPTGDAPTPLVMLHGFTQNGRCLGPMAERIALVRPVMTPDMPGHGGSADDAGDSLSDAATRLVEQIGSRVSAPHWFGYSMGGRVALQLAVDHPHAVGSLVLLGATPGICDTDEREARADVDEQRAQRIESVGVEQFCAEWLDAPMFSGLPDWARFTSERHSNTVPGLAGSIRNAGTGSMAPLWERLGDLEMDVLLLAGALDQKFVGIATEMADAIGPNARVETIEDAGHAAHLEAAETTVALISAFLSDVEEG